MKFFDRFRFLFSNKFDQFIRKYLEGDDSTMLTGSLYGDTKEMKYSALFACFRVLAETFASVPIKEYQRMENGDREETKETHLFEILGDMANAEMSSYNFHEAMQYQISAGGNAVAKRLYNKRGDLVGLYPLPYQDIEIRRNKDTNELEYKYGQEVLKRKEVFHVPGPSMDGAIGMSILEYAAQAIALGQSYETFGKRFYDNGAMPSGVFEHPAFLKPMAYERLKKDLKSSYTGLLNAGNPMLLEHGLQYKQLTISPVDAQMIENRRFQVEDVCRFCRVPLHLVGELSKATNNNIEHQSIEFVRYTMLPYFRRWEECVKSQLLTPEQRSSGYYFEFPMIALLRGDSESMAKAYATGRQWGWYSVNDIRKLQNMNSIENGDIYLQPVNMIEAGTVVGQDSNSSENSEMGEDLSDTDSFKRGKSNGNSEMENLYLNLIRLERQTK